MKSILSALGYSNSTSSSSASSPTSVTAAAAYSTNENPRSPQSIFDFTVMDGNDEPTSMQKFRGKNAYLIVNVASQ